MEKLELYREKNTSPLETGGENECGDRQLHGGVEVGDRELQKALTVGLGFLCETGGQASHLQRVD